MFDAELALSILDQIDDALETIRCRTDNILSASDFTDSPSGKEKLDGVCMLFAAAGEALKHADKISGGKLLSGYPEIDWKGAIGFRDIIVHHYFDIDAEAVFWIIANRLVPLSETVKKMIGDLRRDQEKPLL
ncbi:MAG: DUF86 domain-containing protein [Nitrospinae bacterium]|nr:DUF86 domain-containing protein [Nitrospinota bacterium]